MQAMIFAAGLGTRLYPITKDKPKALAPFMESTLLEYNLRYLAENGVEKFVINTHHFADKIEKYLARHDNFGLNISISHEINLMDTAGGFAQALPYFNLKEEPILLYNVDVISNFDPGEMRRMHLEYEHDITLAVRNRETSRYLLFNADNGLCGWKNTKTGAQIPEIIETETNSFAFSGIQMISPSVIRKFETEKVYSLIEFYLNEMLNCKIKAYPHDSNYWFDCGKTESLQKAENYISAQ
mgnify:CR=1 FL=1|jgi:NDP-sugar pyrophosphorylase family protein